MLTALVGSLPQPQGLTLPRFVPKSADPTAAYSHWLREADVDAQYRLIDEHIAAVVARQAAAGIDVVTDGELRREHFVYYLYRGIDGIDFDARQQLSIPRYGDRQRAVPVIVETPEGIADNLLRDYRVARAAHEGRVKISLPGPFTTTWFIADARGRGREETARSLAAVVRANAAALAAAGCRDIQIDEPMFAKAPEMACDVGIPLLDEIFAGLPGDVVRWVHVCCGYPKAVDEDDPAKAPPGCYERLADALAGSAADVISLEDAHRRNDLDLLTRFGTKSVMLGVVDIGRTHLESVDALKERIAAAVDTIGADRLIVGSDCGMTLLPETVAWAKIEAMVAAVRAL